MRPIAVCRVFFAIIFLAALSASAQDFPLTFGTHETSGLQDSW